MVLVSDQATCTRRGFVVTSQFATWYPRRHPPVQCSIWADSRTSERALPLRWEKSDTRLVELRIAPTPIEQHKTAKLVT